MWMHQTDRFPRDRFPVPLPCPNCGRTMQLTRSTADTSGITEMRSYGCAECGLWTTEDSFSPRHTPTASWKRLPEAR
jgi:predicted RNA-binding Zn-ribbon protein involved in translation (DUF1610 family)